MAKAENNAWKRALISIGRRFPLARVFRQNVGAAYAGRGFTMKRGQTYTAQGGERVLMNPQLVEFGLMKGSGDGIGWHTITITPEMVGRQVAVFTSVEAKDTDGKASPEQKQWRQAVLDAGGIAVIFHGDEQVDLTWPPQ